MSCQTIARYIEMLTISAYRIGHATVVLKPARAIGHHAIVRLVKRERISHVAIERLVPRLIMFQTPNLPAGGYVDICPRGVIIVLLTHIRFGQRRIFYPIEFPLTIKRLIVGRERQIILYHIGLAGHRQGSRMGLLPVYM